MLLTRYETRVVYGFLTDVRAELEQLIAQCAVENGGKVVGDPSVSFDGKGTRLEVTEHAWWTELMRVRYQQLVFIGINRFINSTGEIEDQVE